MSNLILEKDNSAYTFSRVDFNNPEVYTLYNIISGDLISRGDAQGNPVRLDFNMLNMSAPQIRDFQSFADTYKGIIVTCRFEGRLHFGYIESYNISYMYTREVRREELNDLLELEISTADETDGDISFSFISLNNITVSETDSDNTTGLLLR